jgi:hypothetical protein
VSAQADTWPQAPIPVFQCVVYLVIVFCLSLPPAVAQTSPEKSAKQETAKPVYDPVLAYERRQVRGFRVYVNKKAKEHQTETDTALKLLDTKLAEIVKIVPGDRLKVLRRIPFWIEGGFKENRAAEYHPSEDWLRENGYNPAKVKSVEISNVKNFVDWTERAQPMMVLHELAHGYHDLVYAHDDKAVAAAYENAKQLKLYESVAYVLNDKKRRHYALTNPMEYFAEATEAYFGKNDFYPFTHDELKQYDPTGFALMEKIWGKPKGR